jgi:hypothetical protein
MNFVGRIGLIRRKADNTQPEDLTLASSSAEQKSSTTREILWLFFSTRLLLVVITYIAYILLTAPKYSDTPVNAAALFSSWNHWDAAHYTAIAQYGYQQITDLAFFPLMPLLIGIGARILGGGDWAYIFVGTIISNAALLGTLFLLYQLALELVGKELAQRTLLYYCLFPTAFYFFAPYNESLFLLCATGSFLALRREKWWLAGLLGLFAALARSAGILLVVPYLYELWTRRTHDHWRSTRFLFTTLAPVALIPLGTALYALYCWHHVGNPLAFVAVQSKWSRQTTWPWMGIFQAVLALFIIPQGFGSSNEAHLLLDLGATLSFIALIVASWRTLPRSYSVWMIVFMIFILLSPATGKPDILLSNQRFVLEMFPAFITLALLCKRSDKWHHTLLFLFPALQIVLSIAFIMNRWIV